MSQWWRICCLQDWMICFCPPPVTCPASIHQFPLYCLSIFPQCTCAASFINFTSPEMSVGPHPPFPSTSFAFWLHVAARVLSGVRWLIGSHLSLKGSLAICAHCLVFSSSLVCATFSCNVMTYKTLKPFFLNL